MGTSNQAVIEAVSFRKALPTAKRQRRSPELKLKIVQETLAPGASVARVARAHGVNANQLFNWRRLYRQGQLKPVDSATPGLLAVRVAETEPFDCAQGKLRRRVAGVGGNGRNGETHRTPTGTIQIELPKGRLRLTGSVDAEALRVALEALRG